MGCKSPLTGGIKEANGGGSFSYGLGQQKIAGFTLHGASPDWVVIHFKKDGTIEFDDAAPYLGKGNFEAQDMLHAQVRQEGHDRPLRPRRRVPGPASRASPSATRTAGRRGCRRAAAWAR